VGQVVNLTFMTNLRLKAPARCLMSAREAAERQLIALEMENRVVAPQSAYDPLYSFDDPDYGFHFPEI
jgi:hypothetical protein